MNTEEKHMLHLQPTQGKQNSKAFHCHCVSSHNVRKVSDDRIHFLSITRSFFLFPFSFCGHVIKKSVPHQCIFYNSCGLKFNFLFHFGHYQPCSKCKGFWHEVL